MHHRFFWPAIVCIALILVLIGMTWALGGYQGTGVGGGVTLMLGIAVPVVVVVGILAIILYGRRSRRDEAVHRANPEGDID